MESNLFDPETIKQFLTTVSFIGSAILAIKYGS